MERYLSHDLHAIVEEKVGIAKKNKQLKHGGYLDLNLRGAYGSLPINAANTSTGHAHDDKQKAGLK